MNYIKKITKPILYIIIFIIGLTLFGTLLNYLNILNGKMLSIYEIISILISSFAGGFINGKRSDKKGWLDGLKLSLIFLVLLTIFNYLALNTSLSFKSIVFYVIVSISIIFGSMIGINKKIEKKNQ